MRKLFLTLGITLLLGAGCLRKTETLILEAPSPTLTPVPTQTLPLTEFQAGKPTSKPSPALLPTPQSAPAPAPIPAPQTSPSSALMPAPAPVPSMIISSSVFKNGGPIPSEYSCDGGNYNPPLSISNAPTGTKSLALIMDDPDAVQVVGYTWVHWVVWNISPDVKFIVAGSVPQGASEGTTSFDSPGYGGPCPPSGTHRYFFKLYALDAPTLNLSSATTASGLQTAMKGHVLKQATLMGTYTK